MSPPRTRERLLAWADTFLPDEGPQPRSVDAVRSARVAVAHAAIGLLLTPVMSALHAGLGSPLAATAIACVAVGLAPVPWLLRRGVSVVKLTNLMIALAYLATLGVALRAGGPASPANVWSFQIGRAHV